uniref:PiggyBac transposable element-derived protein domain-containing protein n=1 Tax=Magallana gigas TaxID=29159 RepID=A0A8W8HU72_MAGGI
MLEGGVFQRKKKNSILPKALPSKEIKKEADHNRMVGEGKLEASHRTLSLKKNRNHVKMDRKQRTAAKKVRDLVKQIRNDESDIDDFESSAKKALKTQKSTSVLDSDSESENIPLAAYINEKKQNRDHRDPPLRELSLQDITEDADLLDVLPQLQNQQWNWSNQQFKEPSTDFTGKLEEAPPDGLLKTPLQFFKLMVTDHMISNISEQTNLYAMQKEGIQLSTTQKEIEIMIGVYLRMGLVQMPRVRA